MELSVTLADVTKMKLSFMQESNFLDGQLVGQLVTPWWPQRRFVYMSHINLMLYYNIKSRWVLRCLYVTRNFQSLYLFCCEEISQSLYSESENSPSKNWIWSEKNNKKPQYNYVYQFMKHLIQTGRSSLNEFLKN